MGLKLQTQTLLWLEHSQVLHLYHLWAGGIPGICRPRSCLRMYLKRKPVHCLQLTKGMECLEMSLIFLPVHKCNMVTWRRAVLHQNLWQLTTKIRLHRQHPRCSSKVYRDFRWRSVASQKIRFFQIFHLNSNNFFLSLKKSTFPHIYLENVVQRKTNICVSWYDSDVSDQIYHQSPAFINYNSPAQTSRSPFLSLSTRKLE